MPLCSLTTCLRVIQGWRRHLGLTNGLLLPQVGFLQTNVLGCLGCLWFNRNEVFITSSHAITAGRSIATACVVLWCPAQSQLWFSVLGCTSSQVAGGLVHAHGWQECGLITAKLTSHLVRF